MRDPRFKVIHQGEELSLVTRSSDGQMLFLANMASKMNIARCWVAALPKCITAVHYSPAMQGRARAISAAGSSKTTGLKPSSHCRSTFSTIPASPLTSGCCRTESPHTAKVRCSSSTRPNGSNRCARTSARKTASFRLTTSNASAALSSISANARVEDISQRCLRLLEGYCRTPPTPAQPVSERVRMSWFKREDSDYPAAAGDSDAERSVRTEGAVDQV